MQGEATVNLSDVIALSEKNADLKIANNDLKTQLTEVKVELKQLKAQDEQSRPVKVVTRTIRESGWGGMREDSDIQYSNLDSVRSEIQKEYESKEYDNLVKIKDLEYQIHSLNKDVELKGDEFDAFQVNETKRFKIKADNLEASFKEKANKLDQKIEDKSDKELEDKRIEEIKTLKKRIKTLEEEVKLLGNLGFISRTWRKLTNHVALKAAKKELEIEEKAANKVAEVYEYNGPGYLTKAINNSFRWLS
jgi:hypothetical protein